MIRIKKKYLLSLVSLIIISMTTFYVVTIFAAQEPCIELDKHVYRCDYTSNKIKYRSISKLKIVARNICNKEGRLLDPDSMRELICDLNDSGDRLCQVIEFMCAPIVYGIKPDIGIIEGEKESDEKKINLELQ